MSARRVSLLGLSFALALPLLSGCKRKVHEAILIGGSSTMQTYLGPVVQAFASHNPSVAVALEGGGAAAGVIAVKRDAIDIATLTRPLRYREDAIALRDYLVAKDGVAILVHPSNAIAGLSVEQLTDIYTKHATSWTAVGGADRPIVIVTRTNEPPSGTSSGGEARSQASLRALVLGGDEMPKGREVVGDDGLVAAVKADPGAIGFVGLRHLPSDGVKVVPIGGVSMSRLTILSGRYPLSQSFFVVTYGSVTPAVERFIEFVHGKEGQGILDSQGLVAVQ